MILALALTALAVAQDSEQPVADVDDRPAAFQSGRARGPHPADGWKTFGVQTGFFVTGLATIGPALRSPSMATDPVLTLVAAETVWLSGAALAGAGMFATAKHGDWNPKVGWGASTAVPGAYVGLLFGAGLVGWRELGEPLPRFAVPLAVSTAVGGAALGYLRGHAWADDHGPGGELGWMWAGMFLGLMAGVAASQEFTPHGYGDPRVFGTTAALGSFAAAELCHLRRKKRQRRGSDH